MAAGGFRTFVAGETLDEDKINDFLMQGVLVFEDEAARDAAITAPVHGQVAFLKDSDTVTFYDGASWQDLSGVNAFELEYVVVAGGGASGARSGGGGGAGGYRSNVDTESSGGGSAGEPPNFIPLGTFSLSVGAGGAAGNDRGGDGSDSTFYPVTCLGGGGGAYVFGDNRIGSPGGSGGGGAAWDSGTGGAGGAGTAAQGFAGGNAFTNSNRRSAGGGGAAGAGATSSTGLGGPGVSSSITGTAVTRAVGGGGSGSTGSPSAGAVNTGNGGDGQNSGDGLNGGSGVIIFKVADTVNVSFSAGVTQSVATGGGFSVYTVTETDPGSTVTIG